MRKSIKVNKTFKRFVELANKVPFLIGGCVIFELKIPLEPKIDKTSRLKSLIFSRGYPLLKIFNQLLVD